MKKALEVIGKAMCLAFGLEGSPIRRYDRVRKQWSARFRIENAGAGDGGEIRVVRALR